MSSQYLLDLNEVDVMLKVSKIFRSVLSGEGGSAVMAG